MGVCLGVGQVRARGRGRMEEMVVAEVDIMEATVETVVVDIMVATVEMVVEEGGGEEEMAEEEGSVADEDGILMFWLLAAVPRKREDAIG